jgi:hypothetical protein
MKKIIVYVATYNPKNLPDRIDNFLGDYRRCYDKLVELYGFEPMLVITNTGGELSKSTCEAIERLNGVVNNYPEKRRTPRDLVFLKVKGIEPFTKGDPIIVAWDDDYSMNPYALAFTWKIYQESKKVNYLSLLKPMDKQDWWEWDKVCGFDFAVAKTMVGGSSSYRWSVFSKHIYDYFSHYKVDGKGKYTIGEKKSFDQTFWQFIESREVIKTYHLWNLSLIQHCNYGSIYKERGARLGHYYGRFYDPFCNPFELMDVKP